MCISLPEDGRPLTKQCIGTINLAKYFLVLHLPTPSQLHLLPAVGPGARYGTVFYDEDFRAQLARPNLDMLLQRIYLQNSDLVVVFLSTDYSEKEFRRRGD
jgi:hypothetical protein